MAVMFIIVDPYSLMIYPSNTYTYHRNQKLLFVPSNCPSLSDHPKWQCNILKNYSWYQISNDYDLHSLLDNLSLFQITIVSLQLVLNSILHLLKSPIDAFSYVNLWSWSEIRVKWICSTNFTFAITSSHDDSVCKAFKSRGILPEYLLCHITIHYLFSLEVI
jgi:hypothetical protein